MSRMRDIRKERKLTQAQLGKAVGVANQWISQIEKGQDNAAAWLAEAIARALCVSVGDIFEKESERIRYRVKK